jgi:hypothetical protein
VCVINCVVLRLLVFTTSSRLPSLLCFFDCFSNAQLQENLKVHTYDEVSAQKRREEMHEMLVFCEDAAVVVNPHPQRNARVFFCCCCSAPPTHPPTCA